MYTQHRIDNHYQLTGVVDNRIYSQVTKVEVGKTVLEIYKCSSSEG